ncbi:hypothetical protein OHT57_01055 [Streptomyces sp. NBC_00285]|uniref:hypothetical protein n=1 Tax=Streptomyces sp. NBC_00285 TaxID=2975700 RepID=UPI002E2BEA8E|nr:hypothetical protein [Streptomyces sp. NBC_00285]
MTAIAVMTALTGCGGGDSVGRAGERATTTARAADREARDEVTPDAVRGDVRSVAAAAGIGRLSFLDTSKAGNPCRVVGSLRTEDAPKREAVDSVLAVLKARGWGQMEQMLAEDTDQAWRLKKNGWEMILGAGKVPEGAGIVFDASGEACGVPMPSRPAASDTAPPEPPVLP